MQPEMITRKMKKVFKYNVVGVFLIGVKTVPGFK